MTMELREIVRNDVTLQRGGPSAAAFGIKAVMSPHTIFTERMKSYASTSEMLDDGWNIGDPAYDNAAKAFTQKNRPDLYKVGRVQVDEVRGTVPGTGPLTVGTVYSYESADLGDAVNTTVSYTVVNVLDVSNPLDPGTVGAGTSSIKFPGVAGDALLYRTGYTFTYSGDTTPAANATYTVRAPGATFGAGAVTVPVVETIVAATWDGTLTISNDKMQVAAGLVTAHNAAPGLACLATDNLDGTFDINTGTPAEAFIAKSLDTSKLTFAPQTLGGAGATDAAKWVTSLNAIKAYDNEFYGITDTARDDTISAAIAGWVEADTDERIYINVDNSVTVVDVSAAADTTSVPAILKALGYDRTRCLYNSTADGSSSDEWYDAASITQNLVDIDTKGSSDFYGKDMTGITPESLTTTQKLNLAGKDVDHCDSIGGYTGEYGGILATGGGGRMISGKPCAAVVGTDFFSIRLREAIFEFLHTAWNNGQLAFTQESINQVQAVFEGVVNNCVRLGVFALDTDTYGDKGYYLKFPAIGDVTASDRTAGILRGIDFQATTAGGIHFVMNNITVSY